MSEVAQKAKIKWVVEGDENTKFFHGMLKKKHNQRSIRGIMVNGTRIDDPVKVKYEFLDHFRNRFDKPPENRARIDICLPNVLLNDQRDDLERMVTKEEVKKAVWDCGSDKSPGPDEEVKKAVWDCGSDKSPGPDGLSFSFFRHFWSTIEKDIFEAVDCFFTNEDMPNGFNVIGDLVNEVQSAFVVDQKILDGPFILNETRVIKAIHGDDGKLDKDVIVGGQTKILTNRQVNVIGDLVNDVQSVFVAEQQILDRQFILNEVIQWSKIMGVNVEDGKIQNAAFKLGCLILKTSFTYLGTEVGENMSRKEAWKEVVDKSSLWTRVIKAIHGDDGKLNKDVIVGGQTCWTSIVKEARSLKCTGINVVDLIHLKLGNGDSSSI
nr:RNA-directed DNA polymerase, eukaryota [Tanacetum cinerariifolium]